VPRRRATAAVLAVPTLVLTLGLAACGGDDDTEAGGSSPSSEARPTSGGEPLGPADEGIEGVEAFEVTSASHTEEDLAYDHSPPVGGEHHPVPATCGFYESDPPPEENLVHSIEHGSIWIAYGPDVPDAELENLRDIAGGLAKVVVTPYEGLDSPLVVTTWARQMALDSVDDPRLGQFVQQYRSSQPSPEPNAHCEGVGEPDVPAGTG
jgi:hypothetical protein